MRLLLPLLLLAGCAGPGVVAEGRGADASAALADAQRRAVEAEAGLALSARTRVRAGLAEESVVEARARGVVSSYEVLEEASGPEGYRARIRAVVAPAPPPRPAVRGAGPAASGARRALGGGPEDADVIVVVSEQAARPVRGSPHPGLRAARATVTLKAARADGDALAQLTRSASALEADSELAREAALERAGYEAGLALAAALSR